MLKLQCDRCLRCADSVEIRGMEIHSLANAHIRAAYPVMPDGWSEVNGKHLCERCTQKLEEFLRQLPQAG